MWRTAMVLIAELNDYTLEFTATLVHLVSEAFNWLQLRARQA